MTKINIQDSFKRLNADVERRADLAERIKALASRGESQWTADDRRDWKTLNSAYDAVIARLEMGRSRIGRDGASLDSGPKNADLFGTQSNVSDLDLALDGWGRNSIGLRVERRHHEACERYGQSLTGNSFVVRIPTHGPMLGRNLPIRNDLQTGSGPAGGFINPESFMPRFERALLDFSGVLQVAEVITTDNGNVMPWPTVDDTTNTGEMIGESQQTADDSGSANDPKFGRVTFDAFVFSSKIIRASVSEIQDSGVSLPGLLGSLQGERIGRRLADSLTNGPGGFGPRGILFSASLGATAALSTNIGGDDLYNLEASVDPAYLNGSNNESVGWLCSNAIWNVIRKLKDGMGRYLWEPNLQVGMPPLLLGWPVYRCQAMPTTIAGGTKSLIFGKLDQYKVRRVSAVRQKRLVERYAEYDEEGFIGYGRFDGALIDPAQRAVKYLQH